MTNKLADCLVIYASKSAMAEIECTLLFLALFGLIAFAGFLLYRLRLKEIDRLHNP